MQIKNLRIYRLDPSWALDVAQLSLLLEQHQFQPGTSQDPTSLGWVEPRAGHSLAYQNDNQILLSMRSEKKLLLRSVINQVARAKAAEIAEEQGYKPGCKQMQEIKEQVITELRSTTENRALVKYVRHSTEPEELGRHIQAG